MVGKPSYQQAFHVSSTLVVLIFLAARTHSSNETNKQCYEDLGCFPTDSPWTTLTRPVFPPMSPDQFKTKLYCFTRAGKKKHKVTVWPHISLGTCPFDSNKTVALIIHGFLSDGNFTWPHNLKDRYLENEDATVFIVDWGKGAQILPYFQAASNTRIVGSLLARFISFLQNTTGLDVDKVHLMGHSLGAHIAGYAGKKVPGIGRITAFDPAQPCFEGESEKVRLTKNDTKFLDAIHTNAVPFIPTAGFGCIKPLGHVDFYFNGGAKQPGCSVPNVTNNRVGDLLSQTLEGLGSVFCSHKRAHEYFTYALQKNCFIWGRAVTLNTNILSALTMGISQELESKIKKCTNSTCIPLGMKTREFPARGVFSASTGAFAPYCSDDTEKILAEMKSSEDDPITTESTFTSIKKGIQSLLP